MAGKIFLRSIGITIVTMMISSAAFTQELSTLQKQQLIKASDLYKKGEYQQAETIFREALSSVSSFPFTTYNIANCLFRLNKYKEAIEGYEHFASVTSSNYERSKALYNVGNSYFLQNDLEKAIDYYKQALKLNSFDEDARYNLSYALKLKKQQKKKENQKEEEKEKEKEGEKEKEKGEEKEKENNDKDNKQKEQDKEGNSSAKQEKKSKEDARKILQTLNSQEKKIQQKMNKEKGSSTTTTKTDW